MLTVREKVEVDFDTIALEYFSIVYSCDVCIDKSHLKSKFYISKMVMLFPAFVFIKCLIVVRIQGPKFFSEVEIFVVLCFLRMLWSQLICSSHDYPLTVKLFFLFMALCTYVHVQI